MSTALTLLRRFAGQTRGAVAVVFAVALIPLLLLIGAAVDLTALVTSRSTAQDAVDAAVLTAAKAYQTGGQTADQKLAAANAAAVASLNAQLINESARVISPSAKPLQFDRGTGALTLVANARAPSAFGKLLGVAGLPFSVSSQALAGQQKMEVALVLDNTGSMAGYKLATLKTAAAKLVDDLAAAGAGGGADAMKIGLVPFSMTVNVGEGAVNAPWLDRSGQSPAANAIFSAPTSRFTLFQQMGVPWAGCVEMRPQPFDVQDTPPSAGNPATLYIPFFAPDEPDVGNGLNNYLSDRTGGGFRQRQANVAKYTGRPRSGEFMSGYQYGPNAGCALQPLVRLTTAAGTVKTGISAMTAVGDTNIGIGLTWGWNLLSPTGPFSDGVRYDAEGVKKIVVLMTDGQNTNTNTFNDNRSYYSSVGYIWEGRLGITDGSAGERQDAMDDRLTLLCRNMKNKGVILYTVRLEVTDGSADVLRNCASSPDRFHDVRKAEDLGAAFGEIATSITKLRLAR